MIGAGRPAAFIASIAALLALAACASVRNSVEPIGGERLSGRMSVRVEAAAGAPARSVSAAFELEGSARAGRLNLSTPLGSTLAQARWNGGTVVLATPDGERRFDDVDALTREVLGESIPLAALFDWLRGRPWGGANSVPSPAPAAGFEQLGWAVDLSRFDEAWVGARRERPPAVTVRAKLDRP